MLFKKIMRGKQEVLLFEEIQKTSTAGSARRRRFIIKGFARGQLNPCAW
jgi:hypothetical protein